VPFIVFLHKGQSTATALFPPPCPRWRDGGPPFSHGRLEPYLWDRTPSQRAIPLSQNNRCCFLIYFSSPRWRSPTPFLRVASPLSKLFSCPASGVVPSPTAPVAVPFFGGVVLSLEDERHPVKKYIRKREPRISWPLEPAFYPTVSVSTCAISKHTL